MVVFGQKLLTSGKVIENGLNCFYWEKLVVFRHNGCNRAKLVDLEKSGCIRAKVAVFG